jgi:hypothetical protein
MLWNQQKNHLMYHHHNHQLLIIILVLFPISYDSNPKKNISDIEVEKIDSPLTEYIVSEQKYFQQI